MCAFDLCAETTADGIDFAYNGLGQYVTISRYSDTDGTELVAVSTYGYDNTNRLTSLEHALGSDGSTTLDYAFGYDVAGRMTALTTPDGSSDLGYDSNSQLTDASLTDESYSYDANGNRTSGGTITNDDNRPSEDNTYTYGYDAEGNLTSRTRKDGTGSQEFTWDYRNRLTGVTTKNGDGDVTLTATYSYDAFDRRIARALTGSQTLDEQYLYQNVADANAVLVLNGSAAVTLRQLNGLGANEVFAEDRISGGTGTSRWLLGDHEGSIRDVVDDSGAVADHTQYDSFGNVLSQTDADEVSRVGYTGAPADGETGFVYLFRRYMDVQSGRFISEDPKGFAAGDTNLSRYVGNDPVGYTDPNGLCAEEQANGTAEATVDRAGTAKAQLLQLLAAGLRKFNSGDFSFDDAVNMSTVLTTLKRDYGGEDHIQAEQLVAVWLKDNASAGVAGEEQWKGLSGKLKVAQLFYNQIGDELLSAANEGESQVDAFALGFAGKLISNFGSMLNVPAQREARIAESDRYELQYGMSPFDAWLLSSSERLPVVGSIVNGYEMWNHESYSGFDLGRKLNGWDYAEKTNQMVGDTAFTGAMAEAVTKGIARTAKRPTFSQDPNSLFPENYAGLEKTTLPDGKIIYKVQAGPKTYKVEFHPEHVGGEHFPGDHYHVYKLADFPVPPDTMPKWFRIPNLDPSTPAIPGGGTFAPDDALPTLNKATEL